MDRRGHNFQEASASSTKTKIHVLCNGNLNFYFFPTFKNFFVRRLINMCAKEKLTIDAFEDHTFIKVWGQISSEKFLELFR